MALRSRWFPVTLPTLSLLACSVHALLDAGSPGCAGGACHHDGLLTVVEMLLVPLLGLVLRGTAAALRQLWRTRRALRVMLSRPQGAATPALEHIAERLGLVGRLTLIVSDTPQAFCYGLLQPRICVTTGLLGLLTPPELEAVVRHELHHLRRFDPLRTLGWTLVSGALWWLEPQADTAHLRRELAADQAVIAAGGRLPLGRALLKVVTEPQPLNVRAAGLAISGLSVTNARIDQVLQGSLSTPDAPLRWDWLLVLATMGAAVVFCSVVMTPVWG